MLNQNPEQRARDALDAQLCAAGWTVQDKDAINFNQGEDQAVREYTPVEDQTKDYATAKLKWVQHTGQPLPFLYEATGVITRLLDLPAPFDAQGGLGKMHQLFGDGMEGMITEMNQALTA